MQTNSVRRRDDGAVPTAAVRLAPVPRRRWLAALMSLVLPGFGQLYDGDANRAIWWFAAFALLVVPGPAVIALVLPAAAMMPMLVAGLAATLAVWIGSVVDAWRRASPLHELRPWQRSGTYLLVFVATALVAVPALTRYVRANLVESFRVPSASMSPTLLAGDFFYADKRYNCPRCGEAVRRGDIAIFTYPNDRTLYYVKRVIGLPGDTVTLDGNDLAVNGVGLTRGEPSDDVQLEGWEERRWRVRVGPGTGSWRVVVPPGQVFVLGDNRAASTDSRAFGTVPLADVVARARQIWLSADADRVRFDRIGLVPDSDAPAR